MGAQAISGTNSAQNGVAQRYHVQKIKLGSGSFGTVWRGVDRKTGEVVAVKQLDKAQMAKMNVRREHIEREMQMMKTCVHENLLRMVNVFEDHQFIHLALEYCGDGDLADKLRERSLRLQDCEVAAWIRQICAAIATLHTKGVCHRDIKPDNFMLSGQLLKLADFGLAVFLPRGKLLAEKCGTPAFMAPELHRLPKQSRGYGLPVDMWAAGISFYMIMAGGRHPFLDSKGNLDQNGLLQGSLDFSTGPQLDLADQVGEFFGFGQERPPDPRFPDTARDLCSLMVQVNPAQRITAEAALRHPWLATAAVPIHIRAPKIAKAAPQNLGAQAVPKPVVDQAQMPLVRPDALAPKSWMPAPANTVADTVGAVVGNVQSEILKAAGQHAVEEVESRRTDPQEQLPPKGLEESNFKTTAPELDEALTEAQQLLAEQEAMIAELRAELAALRLESHSGASNLAVSGEALRDCMARLQQSEADCSVHEAASERWRLIAEERGQELALLDQELAKKDGRIAEQEGELRRLNAELSQRCARRSLLQKCCSKLLPRRRLKDAAAPPALKVSL